MVYFLQMQLKNPVTGDVRNQTWRFDPANLDVLKMQALRTKILGWVAEMDAVIPTDVPTEL